MISYIKGKIVECIDNNIVIENNGIGYELFASTSAVSKFSALTGEVTILVYLQVKEDDLILYGFADKNEKNMFEKLIKVSGVGPKLAITILSGISPSSLGIAILNGDLSEISKVKGLGKKTAEKIIVELREKVGSIDLGNTALNSTLSASSQNIEDAAFALSALGFTKTDAIKLASKVAEPNMSAEAIIKKCLKDMGK